MCLFLACNCIYGETVVLVKHAYDDAEGTQAGVTEHAHAVQESVGLGADKKTWGKERNRRWHEDGEG